MGSADSQDKPKTKNFVTSKGQLYFFLNSNLKSNKKSDLQKICLKIRDFIEKRKFKQAVDLARGYNIPLDPNGNSFPIRKYLNCPLGYDEDYIIPNSVLRYDLGIDNRRCLEHFANRDSVAVKDFKVYLEDIHYSL